MTADTSIIPIQPPSRLPDFTSISGEARALSIEIAKCLKLVAPAAMTADGQLSWIASALDALDGIRASEVSAISAELRRSVTRPAQIVPEISRLVAERRRNLRDASDDQPTRAALTARIDREAMERRGKAKTRQEIDDAVDWERRARIDAGLPVASPAKPLSMDELEAMRSDMVSLGLKSGFLERRNGRLVEIVR